MRTNGQAKFLSANRSMPDGTFTLEELIHKIDIQKNSDGSLVGGVDGALLRIGGINPNIISQLRSVYLYAIEEAEMHQMYQEQQ